MVREVGASDSYSSSTSRRSSGHPRLSGGRRSSNGNNSTINNNNGIRGYGRPNDEDAGDDSSRRDSLNRPINARGQHLVRQASGLSNSTTVGQEPTVRPILANFELWMKLVKENKINSSNSWNMELIDYFHDMSLLKDGDGINFQKASYTLDGCVKIYTSRVDSVATETGRLLTGLSNSRTNEFDNSNSAEEDADGEGNGDLDDDDGACSGQDEAAEDDEARKKKESQKSKQKKSDTLAKNFDQLRVRKLELEANIDPLFRKMCADFDEGGAKGLLLNTLMIDNKGRYAFDGDAVNPVEQSSKQDENINEDKEATQQGVGAENGEGSSAAVDGDISMVMNDDDDDDDDDDNEVAGKSQTNYDLEQIPADIDLVGIRNKFFPNLDAFKSRSVCPSMRFIEQVAKDPLRFRESFEREDMDLPEPTTYKETDDYDYDVDDNGGYFGDDIDPNDLPQSFFEFDPNDRSEFAFGENSGTFNISQKSTVYEPGLAKLTRSLDATEKEILAYFDQNSKNNWRGPEHWRITKLKESRGLTEKKSTKRETPKKKDIVLLDFKTEEQIDFEDLFEQTSPPIPTKAKLQPKLLPPDLEFSSSDIVKLDIKSGAKVRIDRFYNPDSNQNSHLEHTEEEASLFPERYEAPNDQQDGNYDANYYNDGPDVEDVDYDDYFDAQDHFDDNDEAEPGSLQPPSADMEGFPANIKKSNALNYARTAKKVDVRLLKTKIWDLMDMNEKDRSSSVSQQDEMEDNDNEIESEKQHAKDTIKFFDVVQDLKKVYPKQKLKDISTSFCFISVLHLANEKGLTIVGNEDEDDLSITWDPNGVPSDE